MINGIVDTGEVAQVAVTVSRDVAVYTWMRISMKIDVWIRDATKIAIYNKRKVSKL